MMIMNDGILLLIRDTRPIARIIPHFLDLLVRPQISLHNIALLANAAKASRTAIKTVHQVLSALVFRDGEEVEEWE